MGWRMIKGTKSENARRQLQKKKKCSQKNVLEQASSGGEGGKWLDFTFILKVEQLNKC